jgi:hypothetical protein
MSRPIRSTMPVVLSTSATVIGLDYHVFKFPWFTYHVIIGDAGTVT